jgi:NADPH-dependent 7-cyano-7-deazaguanine reductase QueF
MEQSDRPNKTEDQFTKTIEDYTAAIPSSTYLAVAIGAMAFSLMCQVTGQGKWGNFIAQWVPTWLIVGVYNKLDQYDRGR